jgi:3-oxoacyl-[acyl-carrier-protein] synthase II
MSHRVVITGLGPVASIGIGIDAFADSLWAGRSNVTPIQAFDTSGFPRKLAGEVQDFEPSSILENLSEHRWGRSSLFVAAAARLAVADSGIDPEVLTRGDSGSSIGTTSGESQILERIAECQVAKGLPDLSADVADKLPGSRMAHAVNRELGMTGEAMVISTACSASNGAFGYAYDLIRSGQASHMVTGGADSMARWALAGFYRLGALAESACSPFDTDRGGILTAEGGSALFLESLDSAKARGARIYAEVLGYGMSCDGVNMVAPDRSGIARCIRAAHDNAGITPADVDYICAHGTGTPSNDHTESHAIHDVFGAHTPPMSSIKSMLGHTMGAASAFGVIACALALTEQRIPPTINFTSLDPELPDIDPVPNTSREAELNIVQNNGFGFGGNNAITVLRSARDLD